jgi:foldase protein PrsA
MRRLAMTLGEIPLLRTADLRPRWTCAIGRAITGLTCVVMCAFLTVGCGSSGSEPAVVATVAGTPISNATFEHWMTLTAVTSYSANPTRPVPDGIFPRPPKFLTCMSYLRSMAALSAMPTTPKLLRECRLRYERLKTEVLGFLIGATSLFKEAERLGVEPSATEVASEFSRFKAERFPNPGQFRRYLRFARARPSDEIFRMRVDLTTNRLREKVVRPAHGDPQREQALFDSFSRSFAARWKARTICQAGYVVSNCRQYRGPNTTA